MVNGWPPLSGGTETLVSNDVKKCVVVSTPGISSLIAAAKGTGIPEFL